MSTKQVSTNPALTGPRFAGADAPLKAAGRAIYTVDIQLPRMLHAKVLRSAHAHARVAAVDAAAARALPGVRAVLTAEDLPATARSRRVLMGVGERVLSRVDALAAVAAESEEIARQALDLIQVDYEPLVGVFDMLQALDPKAPTLHPGRLVGALPAEQAARLNNVASYGRLEVGDVERGFAESDVIVEEEYQTAAVHQVAMEPHAAIATVEPDGALGQPAKVVVYSSSQTPFGTRYALASMLGLPVSRVALRTGLVGGGFGGKTGPVLEPIAALLALATGQPVRLVNTRYEECLTGLPRPAMIIRVKTGAKRDGTLVARQITGFADGGAGGTGWSARIPILTLGPYRVPNVRAEVYDVFTNNIPTGACRAPAAPPSVFAGESNLDSVARALGLDPVDLRLKNCWRDGDRSWTGQLIEHAPIAEAIRTAAARIGWGKRDLPAGHGIGLAAGWWQSGPGNSTVFLLLNADGSAQLVTGAIEQGPGSALLGLPLIISAEIGIPPEQIEIVLAGTDRGPQDAGSGGSRVTANLGVATLRAARDVAAQLRERAAEELGVPAEQLTIAAGQVTDPESGQSIAVAQLAATAYATGQIVGTGTRSTKLPPTDPTRYVGNIWPAQANPAYFAQAVEVAVDDETGAVNVLRIATALDVGYAISPLAITGQVEGASLQGIGEAIYEEITTREGQVTNADLARYAVPTALEKTEFVTDIIESRRAEGLDGVKGVGEAPICTTPGAIANAVRAAIGRPVHALPMTGERVLAALESGAPDC